MMPSELQQLEMIERKGKFSSFEINEDVSGKDIGLVKARSNHVVSASDCKHRAAMAAHKLLIVKFLCV